MSNSKEKTRKKKSDLHRTASSPLQSPSSSPMRLSLRGLSDGQRSRRNSGYKGVMCDMCIDERITPEEINKIEYTVEKKGVKEFTDLEDLKHVHNLDVRVIKYRCSNGHEWKVRESQNKCWCLCRTSSLNESYSPRGIHRSPRRTTTSPRGTYVTFNIDKKTELNKSPQRTQSSN